jgi:hypothetical protein
LFRSIALFLKNLKADIFIYPYGSNISFLTVHHVVWCLLPHLILKPGVSVKDQIITILGSTYHVVSVPDTQLCLLQHKNSHRMCFNKTLFRKQVAG